MACELLASSMTSRDHDVILVTSQSLKSSHSETRTRSTISVDPLGTRYCRTLCLKISSFGLELWEKKQLARTTALRPQFGTFYDVSNCFTVCVMKYDGKIDDGKMGGRGDEHK